MNPNKIDTGHLDDGDCITANGRYIYIDGDVVDVQEIPNMSIGDLLDLGESLQGHMLGSQKRSSPLQSAAIAVQLELTFRAARLM